MEERDDKFIGYFSTHVGRNRGPVITYTFLYDFVRRREYVSRCSQASRLNPEPALKQKVENQGDTEWGRRGAGKVCLKA